MKIQINKKDLELKDSFRSIIIFESITGKAFQIENLTDLIIYFYSVITASNKDENLTFDDFMNALDNDKKLIEKFKDWLSDVNKVNTTTANVDDEVEESKETKKKRSKK